MGVCGDIDEENPIKIWRKFNVIINFTGTTDKNICNWICTLILLKINLLQIYWNWASPDASLSYLTTELQHPIHVTAFLEHNSCEYLSLDICCLSPKCFPVFRWFFAYYHVKGKTFWSCCFSNITRVDIGENVYRWITSRNKKVLYFTFAASWISFLKKKIQDNRITLLKK